MVNMTLLSCADGRIEDPFIEELHVHLDVAIHATIENEARERGRHARGLHAGLVGAVLVVNVGSELVPSSLALALLEGPKASTGAAVRSQHWR